MIGILLVLFLQLYDRSDEARSIGGRYDLCIAVLPALMFRIMLYGIPRSSRWLVTQSRLSEAREALQAMGSPNSDAELQEIKDSIRIDRSAATEPLFQRKYKIPIILAFTIGIFNQLPGINAILYHLNDIFLAAGFMSAGAN